MSVAAAATDLRPSGDTYVRAALLKNEKHVILAFRFVVALVAISFPLSKPTGLAIPWQFYFVMGIFLLSNIVFFFEGVETFNMRRAQMYIFAFDVGMLTVLMIFLGLTNKEFYLVFFLTIFVSALSKRMSYAFVISAVMSGLYVVFAIYGKTDVELTSASFLVRAVMFFVVSSFVGHISEVAETRGVGVQRLTEWKERVEKLALEQEKMAAVGLLAAGVAHEFNNLLAGLQGYADLAKMGAVGQEEFVKVVQEQCKRASTLVRDLLTFSRKRGGEIEAVDVAEAIEQVLRLVRKELEARGIEVERKLECTPRVLAESGTIERTLLNIVKNAIEAMDQKGKLLVELSNSDGKVIIKIGDNGRGMPPEVLERVFEPFFSTRIDTPGGVVRASGLGLAVSRRLVERCGGTISIDSAPGKGTTVTIVLPSFSGQISGGVAGVDRGEVERAAGNHDTAEKG